MNHFPEDAKAHSMSFNRLGMSLLLWQKMTPSILDVLRK